MLYSELNQMTLMKPFVIVNIFFAYQYLYYYASVYLICVYKINLPTLRLLKAVEV